MTHRIVLDVGKTLSKLTLWSPNGALVERRTRTNEPVQGPGYTALDVAGIEVWLAETLTAFGRLAPVSAIMPVAHGAAAALVRDGVRILPPMDYESPVPPHIRAAYDAGRDPFAATGSPTLPDGLNLGAQLHLLEALHPEAAQGATILSWPQYWAWVLCGVSAAELTSLGCHTDLWNPSAGQPSALAERRGWAARLAPMRRAGDVLGTLRPEIAERTGLPTHVRVHCGLHDSNAALLAARAVPGCEGATLLSTGTWFVAMRAANADDDTATLRLREDRDCLVNVDAHGAPVFSSRFMGGREIETLAGGARPDDPSMQDALLAAARRVIDAGVMALPTFAPGCGPFPNARGRWRRAPADAAERAAAACLYAALVADASLDLIGGGERIVVEGRFASADVFIRALAALRPGAEVWAVDAADGVALGALKLMNAAARPASVRRTHPLDVDLSTYRARWRAEAERLDVAA